MHQGLDGTVRGRRSDTETILDETGVEDRMLDREVDQGPHPFIPARVGNTYDEYRTNAIGSAPFSREGHGGTRVVPREKMAV